MHSVGLPELIVILGIVGFNLLPLAGLVWGLVMLYRIRTSQEAMREQLAAIERSLESA